MQKKVALTSAAIIAVALALATVITLLRQSEKRVGPIAVVSVVGPMKPYLPAGPSVTITLKNSGNLPVTSLFATLRLVHPPNVTNGGAYTFYFNVSDSRPLLPNQLVNATKLLIGGGFDGSLSYPLTIDAVRQGEIFHSVVVYDVKITPPP